MIKRTNAMIGLAMVAAVAALSHNVNARDVTQDTAMHKVSTAFFKSHDANSDGKVTSKEMDTYAQTAFTSIDANDSNSIDRQEFLDWDPGYAYVAAQTGKGNIVEALKMQAFTTADTDGSDSVDSAEIAAIAKSNFAVTDADESGAISLKEFVDGFPIAAMISAAVSS